MMTNDVIANLLGDWSKEINIYSTLLKIVLAVFLSAIIGFERSSKRHAAGLRTFILVTIASTVAMIIEIYAFKNNIGTMLIVSAATIIAVAIIRTEAMNFELDYQTGG